MKNERNNRGCNTRSNVDRSIDFISNHVERAREAGKEGKMRTIQFIGVGIVVAALTLETIRDMIKGRNK